MSDRSQKTPCFRRHKSWTLAVVRIDGRDFYLGKYGTPESRERYDRLIAEWLANGRCLPAPNADDSDITVSELILAYLRHAERYYRKDGTPTGELATIRSAMRPLNRLYGPQPAIEFGPAALKACRQPMIEAGLARTTINKYVDRIRRVFRWAVENEFVPPGVYQGLRAVPSLRRGREGVPSAVGGSMRRWRLV